MSSSVSGNVGVEQWAQLQRYLATCDRESIRAILRALRAYNLLKFVQSAKKRE